MASYLPAEYMEPRWLYHVIYFLSKLRIPATAKKWALYEWCGVVGVKLEGWMVARVTGMRAGKI